MDVCTELENTTRDYLNQLAGRNSQAVMETLGNQLNGFGTGVDEVAVDGNKARELYQRDFAQGGPEQRFFIHLIHVHPLGNHAGVTMALFDLHTKLEETEIVWHGLRFSGVWERERGGWKLVHMHLSVAFVEQKEGESYPLSELQDRNLRLEEEVKLRTLLLQKEHLNLLESNRRLHKALENVRTLEGLLSMCSYCKKIREDSGNWLELESYLKTHTKADISHGICSECLDRIEDEEPEE